LRAPSPNITLVCSSGAPRSSPAPPLSFPPPHLFAPSQVSRPNSQGNPAAASCCWLLARPFQARRGLAPGRGWSQSWVPLSFSGQAFRFHVFFSAAPGKFEAALEVPGGGMGAQTPWCRENNHDCQTMLNAVKYLLVIRCSAPLCSISRLRNHCDAQLLLPPIDGDLKPPARGSVPRSPSASRGALPR